MFLPLLQQDKDMASIDQEVKTKFMNDKHRFVTNLIFTAGWIYNMSAELLKPYGLSNQQFNILRILRGAKDWVAMSKVKELMIEKSPNATRLANKMLDKGLIDRQRSEADRRVVYVRITPKGLDLLKEIDNHDGGDVSVAMDRVTDEEARIVSEILDRMRG